MKSVAACYDLADSMNVVRARVRDSGVDDLLEGLMRGEAHAVRRVYRQHHEQVRAFARRLLGSDADAEEVVQEVFVALPKALRRFRGESTLSTFVMGVAVNHARHYLRSAMRRRAALDQVVAQECLAESPDAVLEREQLAERLLHAMGRLTEEQRVAFVLCEVEERSSSEAADILGVPASTLRARVGAAREILRAALAEEAQP